MRWMLQVWVAMTAAGCGASFDELLSAGDIGAACRAVADSDQTESQRRVLVEDMHDYLAAGVKLRPVSISELEERYGVAMDHTTGLRFWEMELDGQSLPDDAVVQIRQVWIGRDGAPPVKLAPRKHKRRHDPLTTADIERLIPLPRGAQGQREQLQSKTSDLSSACVASGGLTEFVRLFLSPPTEEEEEEAAAKERERLAAMALHQESEHVRAMRAEFARVARGCDRAVSGMPRCKKLMVEKPRRSRRRASSRGDFVEFVYSSRRGSDRCYVADRFRVALSAPAETALPQLFQAGFVTMNSLRSGAEVLPLMH